jgi:hypothetical protein
MKDKDYENNEREREIERLDFWARLLFPPAMA